MSDSESRPLLPPATPHLSSASRSKLQARRYLSHPEPASPGPSSSSGPAPASASPTSVSSSAPGMYPADGNGSDNETERHALLAPSEKALGKRRARSPSAASASASASATPALSHADGAAEETGKRHEMHQQEHARVRGRAVTVIFNDAGMGNLEVWVEGDATVGRVKEHIRELRPALTASSLRLIHAGRLLTDGILLVPWLRALEDRMRRQTGAARGVGGVLRDVGDGVGEVLRDVGDGLRDERRARARALRERVSEDTDTKDEKVWLHCIVGGSEARVADEVETAAPRRRGFDVLLDAGLSAGDVAAMRRQFYESRGEEVPDGLEAGDVNDEHARALEEQWIEGDATADTATTSTEGMYTSILHGLLVGFLLPLTPWFFFREPPLPNFFDAEADADARAVQGARARVLAAGAAGVSPAQSQGDTTAPDAGAHEQDPAQPPAQSRSFFPGPVASAAGLAALTGDQVASVVFGKRMQMGILLGTLLNFAFGALRLLN
ncbi:hypothetical protein Q5752_004724 [Cryptotrichosporon argae]